MRQTIRGWRVQLKNDKSLADLSALYEGLKRSNATIVIVPSTAVESMQLGGAPMATIASAIAHAQAAGGTAANSGE